MRRLRQALIEPRRCQPTEKGGVGVWAYEGAGQTRALCLHTPTLPYIPSAIPPLPFSMHRLLAEIGRDDLGILLDLVRRSFGNDLAVVEHVDPLADSHDDLHVVLDEKDRKAELAP